MKINKRAEERPRTDSDSTGSNGDRDEPVRETKARIIMRTDGVHRVILNTPIFRGMQVGQSDGSEPTGKTMHLSGLEDGKPKAFQIKVCSPRVFV